MKRLLICCIMVIAVFLLLYGVSAYAEISGSGSGFAWILDDEGTLTVSGDGEIPNFVDSYYWKYWGSYKVLIKKVIIDEGITRIGNHAFSECNNMECRRMFKNSS